MTPAKKNKTGSEARRWLLLIHQIPPKPDYLRVKVWRRLHRVGALPLKNSVYVLPRTESALEDFHWIRREITAAGGDATVCEAHLVEGLADKEVETLFRAARDAEYARLDEEIRESPSVTAREGLSDGSRRERAVQELNRFRKRFAEIAALDFFGAPGRETVEGILANIESELASIRHKIPKGKTPGSVIEKPRGRVWVTRKGIFVDRIASAWLIRRFVDPKATFKYVAGQGYRPRRREIRFDMFDAEFTHEGDLCTFEVLLKRFGVGTPPLHAIAQIVHDIDLKDAKYNRPETTGIAHLIAGIAMAHPQDTQRLARGSALFDDLYEYFRRKGA